MCIARQARALIADDFLSLQQASGLTHQPRSILLDRTRKKIEAFHTNRVSLAFTKIAVMIFLMPSEEGTSWPRVSQMSRVIKFKY